MLFNEEFFPKKFLFGSDQECCDLFGQDKEPFVCSVGLLNWMKSSLDQDQNHVRTYSLFGTSPHEGRFPREDYEDIIHSLNVAMAQRCPEKHEEKRRVFLDALGSKHPNGFAIQAVSVGFVLPREPESKTVTGLALMHCNGHNFHGPRMYFIKPGTFDLEELRDVRGSLKDVLDVIRSHGFTQYEWPNPYLDTIRSLLELKERRKQCC